MQKPRLSQDHRLLDIDDLILIKLLGDGVKGNAAAKILSITPAAICHRVKKYERIWPDFYIKNPKSTREKRTFSDNFHKIYKGVCDALEALYEADQNIRGMSSDPERLAG